MDRHIFKEHQFSASEILNRSGLGEDEPETENFHIVDINLENDDPRQVEQAELTEDSLNVTEKK